jgi:heptosyltransferase-2
MNRNGPIPYQNILLIQTGFIGDMVLTTPLIRSLRRHAPGSRITLLHAPRTEEIIRRCPHVDRRISFDKRGAEKGIGASLRLAAALRRDGFDLVISPHRSVRSGLLAAGSGAARRIGFDHPRCGLFYTDPVPYSRWESTFVRRKLRLLEPLGIQEEDETPEAYWGEEEEREAAALLREASVEGRYAVLAIGSAWPTKRWPPERFGELSLLLEGRGIRSLLVGGPSDRADGAVAAQAGSAVDLTGRFGLHVLAPLLSKAALFVGNDSGTLHLARAARAPAIALFGPTGPEQFRFDHLVRVIRSDAFCAPCSDHGSVRCPEDNWICMPGISAAAVAGEADRLLGETHDI